MLSHERVWAAIDALATRKRLSPSALARRAGLDPTTFNPSKRVAGDGRPRWPSTESLAKILEATGAQLSDFAQLVEGDAILAPAKTANGITMPFARLCEAGDGAGLFDATGNPAGAGWDEISFPDDLGSQVYALGVGGDDYLPLYRDGDIIVIAPGIPIRRGDRIVLRQTTGGMLVGSFVMRTARRLELHTLGSSGTITAMDLDSIAWMARIVWASQ
ncbi:MULTISPECIES: S24 family peptidase [Pannonibacter]|nr:MULTISPECIES: helix-turn-helix transcriptional regulator [Pannonibacter]